MPWRPQQAQAGSSHPLSALTGTAPAPGAQTALVVGPNGSEFDVSAGDVFTDSLGRIRIRLLWQGQMADSDGSTTSTASCWVREAQRSAGAGMGLQFIPRVGQEVLVQFLGGDIDWPIVTGALYNGQGEGGLKPTPARQTAKNDQQSKDNKVAGKGSNPTLPGKLHFDRMGTPGSQLLPGKADHDGGLRARGRSGHGRIDACWHDVRHSANSSEAVTAGAAWHVGQAIRVKVGVCLA